MKTIKLNATYQPALCAIESIRTGELMKYNKLTDDNFERWNQKAILILSLSDLEDFINLRPVPEDG